MGCTQSTIENEEAVARCRERRQLMRSAVTARNGFAAAHSAYTVSLKNTGAALSDYGQMEGHAPRPSQPVAQPPIVTLPPAPPPLPNYPPQPPLQRAATMPEFAIPKFDPRPSEPIQEEDDEEDEIEESDSHLIRRGSVRTAQPEPETPPPPPSPPRTPPLTNPDPPLPPDSKDNPYDFFFSVDMPGSTLGYSNEIRPQNDASGSRDYVDERYNRKEAVVDGGEVKSKGDTDTVKPQIPMKEVEPEPEAVKPQPLKKSKQPVPWEADAPDTPEAKRVTKSGPTVSLSQVLNELDDHFLEASKSAHEVSNMLEANRLHFHSNFADNRGHIDHSARVMRVITWNRSFRGLPNADDGKFDFDTEEQETHATVLDKLLAWEKKLYDEVKAGELMKLEYERKVALLNKQKKRGPNSDTVEKTKAAVSHLHTRYIVDMQSLDSTVAEINRLRDGQLYPKLVELVEGMAKMWETMYIHHEKQLKISAELRSLDLSQAPKETNEQHHKHTVQLCHAVEEWHTHFQSLMTQQKQYIRTLYSWLKLNLVPIESSLKEKVSSPPRVPQPPILTFLRAWNDHFEKLTDALAGSQIGSFAAVVDTIVVMQQEEFKLKVRCLETRKELARKERTFTEWREKYLQRKTPSDEMESERADDPNYKDPILERQFVVEAMKRRLEEELEEHQKQCRVVRDKSLQNLKMQLPDLFRVLAEFAHDCSRMYKNVRSVAGGPA